MFAIGCHKCSTKNEQFGLYGSLRKIENAKDEWRNQGENLSLVGCILGQTLQYVGDKLFQKIQTCYKSLDVPSFDQVNYEAEISTNQGAFEFASTLTFNINRFKNSPHLDKDSFLYASGWWFATDKRTGRIQRDVSKQCTGVKLIFPNEHFWIDLSNSHGLIQVVWASSKFFHYTDPEHNNESTTLVGMSAQCSRRLAKKCGEKAMAIMRLAREQAITSGMDPKASHAKPCTVNPYAGAAFQQCQQFLTPVQAPDASHAKSLCLYRFPTTQIVPYAGEASQQLQHFLRQLQAPNASHANPYACAVSQQFKQLLTPGQAFINSYTNTYACTGSQSFTCTSLRLYRFPKLHMHILILVQVPYNSDHSLRLGSLPKILKILYTTKINSV
ncbi:hypothetical protein O181_093927 [Austropuccinia psidii MF-1]|uniref:Tet-like 2OG-Fe(II) oxygenase domain-containing protein n=1 Tax=Austropuccinia psidii MF-1 TaxID=1389203 RepID=A0A9Q3PAZ2_9BASI|nr:hypothetical protein [Austropuccinia psidii MF-1]